MPERQFEIRQLLKAYRKGLISDELFEEQMREVAGDPAGGAPPAAPEPPARTYRLRDRTFHTEQEFLCRFLDEFRAGETFGGETFALWCATTDDPALRGGLRVVAEREASHGRLLSERLAAIGGRAEASLPASFREKARARFASREITDLDKIRGILRGLDDAEAAVRPIRDVIAQIETDRETAALLEMLIEDETSTLRWLSAAERALGEAAGERRGPGAATTSRLPGSDSPGAKAACGNGARHPDDAG